MSAAPEFGDRASTAAGNEVGPTTPTPLADAGTVNADNPWPGLLAFREADQQFFEGRRTETEDLFRLVMRERLTVFLGLSGLGKSSLLQAGLFPRLRRENTLPIYIRLDFSSVKPDLIAQVKSAIATQAELADIEAPAIDPGETLWEYFHRRDSDFWTRRNRPVMPLIVLDQFEEVFTLGRLDAPRTQATEILLEQLADLVEGRAPSALKEWLDEHPEKAANFAFTRHPYKMLLSIREDFLPELEGLRERMPSVALNRLRLQRMNGSAALRVVARAEHLIDLPLGEKVVRFVAADHSGTPLDSLEVEPALLSVVCRELNNKRQNLHEPKITESLLEGNQDQILSDFYERTIGDLPGGVRSFIEEHLLTVSGFRDSVALENALSLPGVTGDCINQLVARRLLRREDRGGVQRLELTHDLLIGVIRASRDRRRQQEEAEQACAALIEQNRLAAEREKARKRKLRQTQWVAGVLAVMAAISLLLAVVAWREKRRAEASLQLARSAVGESLSSAGREQAREAADLPEMEKFRKELLDKARRFYAIFTEQNSHNEGLRSDAAWAHSRMADVNRLLKNYEDAVREYKAAISGFESLARDHPGKTEHQQALAYAHNWWGETLRIRLEESQGPGPYTRPDEKKQYDEALQQYDEARRLQQQIHDKVPANFLYQQELARTYYNRGILRYRGNDVAGTESDFRTAINLLEPLKDKPAANANTPQPAQDLARAYNNLANILASENPAESKKLYDQAIELAETLNRNQPDNREYKLELAEYCNNEATFLVDGNELDRAKKRNHQAIDIMEELTAPSPSLSMELVKALQLRTEILETQGSSDTQLESDRLLEILKKLNSKGSLREHPVFHVIYMNLGIDFVELAKKNLESGDMTGARAALKSLAEILPELSAADNEKLSKYYLELRKEVQNKSTKRRRTN